MTVEVRRTGGSAGTVSAEYYIKPEVYWGSANAGRDYVPTSGTLTFYGGETTKTFTVTLIDNNIREGNRNFFVGLHGLSGGAVVGSQYQAEVVIVDDDAVLEFAAAQLYGLEGGPAVAVNVIRRGYTNSTVSVVSHVRNGTAIGGEDFWGISAHLDFGPGETNETFLIPIINDEIRELAEEVMLILENASGDASLGWFTNAVLTIHDDDSLGSLVPGFPLEITNFVNHAVPLPQGGILIATYFEFYSSTVQPQLLQRAGLHATSKRCLVVAI